MPSRIYRNFNPSVISVSNSHSACINDGGIIGWGSSAKGKLDFHDQSYKKVSCGYSHSSAITTNGQIVSVGNSLNGKTSTSFFCVYLDVKCSRNHTAALAVNENKETSLVVYGDQSLYGSLPSSLYSRKDKYTGVFFIKNIVEFCISDQGAIFVATSDLGLYRIGHSRQFLGNSLDTVVKIVGEASNGVTLYLQKNGDAYKILTEDSGEIRIEHTLSDCVSIFGGNKYYGLALSRCLVLHGSHFGNLSLPVGWKIINVDGGNNGYAVKVSDKTSDVHMILVGDNTKNKELVLETLPFKECPRIKNSVFSFETIVYDVRDEHKSEIIAISASTVLVETDHKCSPCDFRFVARDAVCPICKCGC